MNEHRNKILSVSAALGALSSALPATDVNATVLPSAAVANPASASQVGPPNMFVSTGSDLLGFTVTEQADGTIVAQHSSHASHASHASHHSHYSSR